MLKHWLELNTWRCIVVVLEEKAVERVGVPVGIDKGYRVGGKVALGGGMRKSGNREED